MSAEPLETPRRSVDDELQDVLAEETKRKPWRNVLKSIREWREKYYRGMGGSDD